jgi:tetratricopeptide (TPR) repeat protein
MKSTGFFQFLDKNISISDQKELFESIRLDSIIWEAFLDIHLIKEVAEQYGKTVENWTIGNICLLGVGMSPDILTKPIREKLYLKKAIYLFENTRNNVNPVETLEEATLLALALYERGAKAQNWKGLLTDLGIQKFESRSQFVNCWRTPLAILYSFLGYHDELLLGIASDKDDNLSISLINHIIAVQLMPKADKVNTIKRLVDLSNSTKQISWYQSFPTQLGFLVPDISESFHRPVQYQLSQEKNLFNSYKNIEDQIQENVLSGYKNLLDKSNNQAHAHFLAAKNVAKKLHDFIDLLCIESDDDSAYVSPDGKDPFFEDILLSNYMDSIGLNQFKSGLGEPKGILLKLSSLIDLKENGETNRAKELAGREFEFWLNQRKNNWPAIDEIELIQRIDHKTIINSLKELELPNLIEAYVRFLEDISKNHPQINPVILNSVNEYAGTETQYVKYKVSLAISPQDKKVRSDLIRLLTQKSEWETLFEEWANAEAKGEIESGDWINYAAAACHAGKLETAERLCEKLSTSGADEGQILAIKGKISFLKEDYELAKTQLLESIRINTDSADAWLTLAEIYSKEGNYNEAVSTLRSAVLAVPGSNDIHYAMANACLGNNQYAEALPYLKKAIALNPENEKFVVDLIRTLKELGHFEEANSSLSKARSKWPLNSDLAYLDAKRSLEKGEREQALIAFKDAIEHANNPENEWLLLYAKTLLNDDENQFSLTGPNSISVGNFAIAQKVLQSLVKKGTGKPSYANMLLGEVYYSLNEFETAHSIYLDVLNSIEDPGSELSDWAWRASAGMGLVKIRLNEQEMGLVMLKDAVNKNPAHLGIKQALAQAFCNMNLEEEGVRVAKEAYGTGSTDVRNLVWYSDFMKKARQSDEVIKALENANLLSNYDEEISLRLANEYVAIGNVQGANSALDSILQKDISNYELLRDTAMTFLRLGNPEKAYTAYKKALINLHQMSLENQIEYVYLCYLNEKWQESLDQVQKLISQNYAFITTYVIQAESLAEINQFGAALSAYEQASASKRKLSDYLKMKNMSGLFVPIEWINGLEKEETIFSKLALAAVRANEFDKGLRCINQVIQMQPGNPGYKLFGADIALQLNDFEAAKNYLQAADLEKETENDEVLACLYSGLKRSTLVVTEDGSEVSAVEHGTKNLITQFIDISQKLAVRDFAGAKNAFWQFFVNPVADDQFSISGSNKNLLSQAWKNTFYRLAIKNAIDLEEFSLANEQVSNWQNNKGSAAETSFYALMCASAYEMKKSIYASLNVKQHRAKALDESLAGKNLVSQYFSKAVHQGKTSALKDFETAKGIGNQAELNSLKTMFGSQSFSSSWKYILIDRLMQADQTEMVEALLLENQIKPMDAHAYAKYQMEKDPAQVISLFLEKGLVNDPLSCDLLSCCFSKLGNFDQALFYSDKALELWPNEEIWKVENAILSQKMGDSERALAKWAKILEESHSIQEVIYPYLDLLLQDDKSEEVIGLLNRYKADLETTYAYHQCSARAYFIGGKFDLALKSVQIAKELRPDDLEVLIIEGKIYSANHQVDKAREIAKSLIQKDANFVEGYLLLVSTYEAQGKFTEAKRILEEALSVNPGNRDLLLNKIWNLRQIGGLPEALAIASQMSVADPSDWEALSLLAILYNDMEDYRAAEENAKKSLRISIDQPEILMLVGQILRKQGHLDQAVEYFSKAAVASAQVIEPCLEIGDIYFEQQNFPEALDAYQEAINRNENDGRPYYKAGLIMKEVKDYQSAEKMLRIAANLIPKDANIRRQLAGVIALNFVHSPLEAK